MKEKNEPAKKKIWAYRKSRSKLWIFFTSENLIDCQSQWIRIANQDFLLVYWASKIWLGKINKNQTKNHYCQLAQVNISFKDLPWKKFPALPKEELSSILLESQKPEPKTSPDRGRWQKAQATKKKIPLTKLPNDYY